MLLKNENAAAKIPSNLLTIEDLLLYLCKRNNIIMVYVKEIYTSAVNGHKIYAMSNGLSYTKNEEEKWEILPQ